MNIYVILMGFFIFLSILFFTLFIKYYRLSKISMKKISFLRKDKFETIYERIKNEIDIVFSEYYQIEIYKDLIRCDGLFMISSEEMEKYLKEIYKTYESLMGTERINEYERQLNNSFKSLAIRIIYRKLTDVNINQKTKVIDRKVQNQMNFNIQDVISKTMGKV